MLFCQNTRKTAGNNAVEMSQAFHDVARFERFTDLNLFKYAFNVIQSGKHTLYNYRGFIKVLNRGATEFDTRAKNWQGPEGLAP